MRINDEHDLLQTSLSSDSIELCIQGEFQIIIKIS